MFKKAFAAGLLAATFLSGPARSEDYHGLRRSLDQASSRLTDVIGNYRSEPGCVGENYKLAMSKTGDLVAHTTKGIRDLIRVDTASGASVRGDPVIALLRSYQMKWMTDFSRIAGIAARKGCDSLAVQIYGRLIVGLPGPRFAALREHVRSSLAALISK